MDNAIKLEELLPSAPEFSLKSTGKTYKLRIFNIDDMIWLEEKIGGMKTLGDLIATQKYSDLVKVAYHQLEDKSEFLATVDTVIDDEGRSQQALTPGPQRFARAIQGMDELGEIIRALAFAVTRGNPMAVKDQKKTAEPKEVSPAGVRS